MGELRKQSAINIIVEANCQEVVGLQAVASADRLTCSQI